MDSVTVAMEKLKDQVKAISSWGKKSSLLLQRVKNNLMVYNRLKSGCIYVFTTYVLRKTSVKIKYILYNKINK